MGVIACGGCNPLYDRAAFYESLKALLAGHAHMEFARRDRRYDLLIILRGCDAPCTDPPDPSVKTVIFTSPDPDRAKEKLAAVFPSLDGRSAGPS